MRTGEGEHCGFQDGWPMSCVVQISMHLLSSGWDPICVFQNSAVWKRRSEKKSINFVLPLICEVSFFKLVSPKLSMVGYKGKSVNLNFSFPIYRIKELDSLVWPILALIICHFMTINFT